MGANQSSGNGTTGSTNDSGQGVKGVKKCYYDVLEIDIQASEEE